MRYILLALACITFSYVKAQEEQEVVVEEAAINGDVIIPAGQTSIPDSAYYKNTEMWLTIVLNLCTLQLMQRILTLSQLVVLCIRKMVRP